MTPPTNNSPIPIAAKPAANPAANPVNGVSLYCLEAQLKYKDRDDLLLVAFDKPCAVAGVFSNNKVLAAPVTWSKAALRKSSSRIGAIIFNSGQANSVTGKEGFTACKAICSKVALLLGLRPEQVLSASTGVIGEQLPLKKFTAALPKLIQQKPCDWQRAAGAIMTTDTKPKVASRSLKVGGKTIWLSGIAKGAGMIAPNMATMLSVVATDAGVKVADLKKLLQQATAESFNIISIDGDCSTNDCVFLAASGASGVKLDPSQAAWSKLSKACHELMEDLAIQLLRDGEGSTKLIECRVTGSKSKKDASLVAKSVAESLLVRTMVAGADANWGRLVMAAGKSKATVDEKLLTIKICGITIFNKGEQAKNYQESQLAPLMKQDTISLELDLGLGKHKARFLSCDLTEEYIRINADYRS